jgi:hypothetical protein
MLDRQQLETILCRRFPGAPLDEIAAAANAIMGLERMTSAGGHAAENGKTWCSSCRHDAADDVAPALPTGSA